MTEKKAFAMGDFTLGTNGNMAIKASAGSGKTFRLAMRFISLLFIYKALDPAQIVAITFTRKASREIFDKIIEVLLQMEQDDEMLNTLKMQGLLPPNFEKSFIPSLLGRVLRSRDLQISTIDSFSVRIIQAFAPEFGISGAVEIVDENTDRSVKNSLRQVIQQRGAELFTLLKTYAEDVDPKRLTETLKEFVFNNYPSYLMYPDERLWGNLPSDSFELTKDEVAYHCSVLKNFCDTQDCIPKVQKLFDDLLDAVATLDPRKFQAFPEIGMEDGVLCIKKHKRENHGTYPPISEEAASSVKNLCHYMAAVELRKKNAKSRAAYRLLKLFDDVYSANVRAQGRLTFRDLPKLLSEISEEKKLDLEYRLDTRNRHYMLDEFQDTSDQQWKFMENLISEAIQGTDQTFFMVGDVKQSLYQWRNGNPKLFDNICSKYTIDVMNSDRSFRSSPVIIDTVNRIFGRSEFQTEKYSRIFSSLGFVEHEANRSSMKGFVSVRKVPKDNEDERKAIEIYHLIQEIKPLSRSLSVAILVRTNKEVEKYKQFLRMMDGSLQVTTEGTVKTSESMACTFLELLIRFAAHPSDGVASRALPLFCFNGGEPFDAHELSELLGLQKVVSWGDLSVLLRKLMDEEGISGLVLRFVRAFEGVLTSFDRERLEIFVRLSRDFEGTFDEFLTCIDNAGGNGSSAEKTIQIMTIHKSKGLEFDIVILPELGTLTQPGYGKIEIEPMPKDCKDFSPSWIGFMPKGDSCDLIAPLREISEKISEDAAYEKCCGFYVALTRAKRALYMFVKDDKVNEGKTFRADHVLINAFKHEVPYLDKSLLYKAGDPDWYKEFAASDDGVGKTDGETPRETQKILVERPEKILRVSPSNIREADVETEDPTFVAEAVYSSARFADTFFSLLGTRIHKMFEAVEYLDGTDENDIRKICGDDDVGIAAWKIYLTAVSEENSIRKELVRPDRPHWLWREKNFLMKDDKGRYVSGCFDRVTVFLDDNVPESAVIYDYKTDALDREGEFIERHGQQLNAYRRTLSAMLSIPEEKISCRILALRSGKCILCPME